MSTTLTGRVAAVLPSGTLVVEAERQITMNNQHETVVLRGLVRPGDLDAANTVLSNNVGDLEVEVKGKGIISEGTRPPNPDREMDSARSRVSGVTCDRKLWNPAVSA